MGILGRTGLGERELLTGSHKCLYCLMSRPEEVLGRDENLDL